MMMMMMMMMMMKRIKKLKWTWCRRRWGVRWGTWWGGGRGWSNRGGPKNENGKMETKMAALVPYGWHHYGYLCVIKSLTWRTSCVQQLLLKQKKLEKGHPSVVRIIMACFHWKINHVLIKVYMISRLGKQRWFQASASAASATAPRRSVSGTASPHKSKRGHKDTILQLRTWCPAG